MIKKAVTSFLIFFYFVSFSQGDALNVTLLAHIPMGENSSDIWGYENNGINYAVIGTANTTRVFSLEDPTNPILRHEAKGANSIWRDIKHYKDFLYVTTDQGQDGLVIIDMSKAPDTISHTFYKPDLVVGDDAKPLQRCHNLYIDDRGICYLAGCNISKRGVLLFDLNEDPLAPKYLGAADLQYSHDAYALGDTLYASEIYLGTITMYDITDKGNPVVIASQNTSSNFTHNAWASTDGKYVFTTDERAFGYVDAYDISDYANIKFLDKFRPKLRENDGVIPHNTHYHNGYLVTSWYTDGVRIVDAKKPDNLIEVAYFDSWEDDIACHANFNGCWGAFPFTGSNHLYISDINNGLFILDVDYKRACYLEGTITTESGDAISNAKVTIVDNQIYEDVSSPSGSFKTGVATAGNYDVIVSHPDFEPQIINVSLNHGEVTPLNVVLKPLTYQDIEIIVQSDVSVSTKRTLQIKNVSTTMNFDISSENQKISMPSGSYDISIFQWGFKPEYYPNIDLSEYSNKPFEVNLVSGYYDDFNADMGWMVTNEPTSMVGAWERAKPRGTYYNDQVANPEIDDPNDMGDYALVTFNGRPGSACADVDNGITVITSPEMNFDSNMHITIDFSHWFFNAGGNSEPNDDLSMYIENDTDSQLIWSTNTNTEEWQNVVIDSVETLFDTENPFRISFITSDIEGSGHILEAGIDNIIITGQNTSNTASDILTDGDIRIYPNPTTNILNVDISHLNQSSYTYKVIDALGREVLLGTSPHSTFNIDTKTLKRGVYVLQINSFQSIRFIRN